MLVLADQGPWRVIPRVQGQMTCSWEADPQPWHQVLVLQSPSSVASGKRQYLHSVWKMGQLWLPPGAVLIIK